MQHLCNWSSCDKQTLIKFLAAVRKKLEAASRKQKCGILQQWSKSVSNHLYWCATSSKGNRQMVLEKWTSIVNHVTNCHEGHGELFPRCLHEPIDRNWIGKGMA